MRRFLFRLALLLPLASILAAASPGLRISDNGRHLLDPDGKPVFLLADTAWSLPSRYSPREVSDYLDAVARGPFNTVQVSAVFPPSDRPLLSGAFKDQDLLSPEPLYWANVDWVVRQITGRGLIAVVNPIWKKGTDDLLEAHGPERCREFGRWFGRRYVDDPRVIYFIGGDAEPRRVAEELAAMAEGIQEVYGGRAIVAYHNSSDRSSLDAYPERPAWLNWNWTYAYSPDYREEYPYGQNHRNYRTDPPLPIHFGEGYYDFGRNFRTPISDRWGNRYILRRQAWWAGFLTGASGYAYGAEAIWKHNHYEYPWQGALRYESRRDMHQVRALVDRLPWWTLVPDLERRFLLGPRDGGDDQAVAALSGDRRLAVLYTPVHQPLELDLGQLAPGLLSASWMDPSDGSLSPLRKARKDRWELLPPEKNAAGDGDFILILEIADGSENRNP